MSEAQPFSVGADVILLTLPLTREHDLVLLRRRLRAFGEEFRFDVRDISRLSTAVYEAASDLFAARGSATAEVRLKTDAPRPVLHVVIQAPVGSESERADTLRRLEASGRRLHTLVDGSAIATTPDGVGIVLVSSPRGGPERNADLVDRVSIDPPRASLPEPDDADMRQRYEHAQRALQEMRIELQETNRGVIAVYTELEDQTERLRQAEDRLRLLLDSVQDYAICMLGADGEIVSWNVGGERLFGYTADEIVGRNYACFFPPAERDEGVPVDHLRVARQTGRSESEGLRVRRGGSVFDAHVVLTPARKANGDLRGFSLVIRDITERKRLEDDLRRRAEDLEAANRAKEDFLATLSHELRTPLNAMLGWTRLMRTGRLDPAATARALETIERNAHVQEQLIADILDVSRIVTGKLRLELRPLELSPIVQTAVDAVSPTADAKGVRLLLDTALSGSVMGDPDRLQQVIWNLLSNAIKFTARGGEVTVSSGRVGANAVIKVADTGEGIAPELLPYVFDRFRQGDASATRPHGGLGLGLSIVRHIVELHGGDVQAWSEGKGKGATFSVQLPVRQMPDMGDEPMVSDLELTGLKILVVDDEEAGREAVSMALAQCGARTAAVGSAREAMRMMEEFQPDVVVSDIMMPEEDGYALVQRIRSLPLQARGVPVVALSAFARPEERERAIMAGFRQFVPKPVEIGELAAAVRVAAAETRK